MKKTTIMLGLATGMLVLAIANSASADESARVSGRSGLTAGIGLGIGQMGCEGPNCDDVTEAGGIDGHLGVMLSPNLAILGELWGMGHTEDRVTITQTLATVGAQLWVTPRFWLRGGFGVARSSFEYDGDLINVSDESETVPGFALGAGVELVSSPDFALDLSLRGGSGLYDDDTRVSNVMLGVGASWY